MFDVYWTYWHSNPGSSFNRKSRGGNLTGRLWNNRRKSPRETGGVNWSCWDSISSETLLFSPQCNFALPRDWFWCWNYYRFLLRLSKSGEWNARTTRSDRTSPINFPVPNLIWSGLPGLRLRPMQNFPISKSPWFRAFFLGNLSLRTAAPAYFLSLAPPI